MIFILFIIYCSIHGGKSNRKKDYDVRELLKKKTEFLVGCSINSNIK